jgi:glutaredoxin
MSVSAKVFAHLLSGVGMYKGLMLLVGLVMLVGNADAAIYRWVDANGTVVFRDTPPPQGSAAKAVVVDATPNGTGTATSASSGRAPQVELFVTSWCPYCEKAKAFLRAHNISFNAYDIERDSAAARRKAQLTGQKGVPFALINGTSVQGFNEGMYRQLLGINSP